MYCRKAVVSVRVGKTIFMVDGTGTDESDLKTIGWLKEEVVHLFCLQLYNNNNSSGMKPIVQNIIYGGNVLDSSLLVKDIVACLDPGDTIDAVIGGWVRITLADRYLVFCKGCNETPNPKLLTKLYNLKYPEEIVASDCELEDRSVLPLLKALGADGVFSVLDLSHNSLGCQTVCNIQEVIAAAFEYKELGLTLDLHNNQLDGSGLLQICKCPVFSSRLEVLNLSGNPLTDASGGILTTIIEECKELAILNLQGCALTGRTIQSIGDALHLESKLMKLSIGKNNPISGNAMANLVMKLSMLKSFSDLDITDVVLNKTSIESLCHLLQSSSISTLAIGGTGIEMNGALKLSGSLATLTTVVTMLDMSFCRIDPHGGPKLCEDLILHGVVELNLSGNRLEERVANGLADLLAKQCCWLKRLMINKCHLGKIGILKIIQALSFRSCHVSYLQVLGLAGNITEDNSFLDIVSGADRFSAESSVQEPINTLNYHEECFDNRASDQSKKNESPTFGECTSILGCVSSKQYNNGAKDERSWAEDVVDGEDEGRANGVNCSSPRSDCASSSQPLDLTRDKSHFILDLHTIKRSDGEYAFELFVAIQMAKNIQFLDLSDNSLSSDMVEQLYVAWSSNERKGTPIKHINNPVVHFSVEGRQCCGLRPCCQGLI